MPVGRYTRYAGVVFYKHAAAPMQTAWKCMANIQADRAYDLDMHENQIPDINCKLWLKTPPSFYPCRYFLHISSHPPPPRSILSPETQESIPSLFVVPTRQDTYRLAESIPRNWFLCSLNVYKYGLWTLPYSIINCQYVFSTFLTLFFTNRLLLTSTCYYRYQK